MVIAYDRDMEITKPLNSKQLYCIKNREQINAKALSRRHQNPQHYNQIANASKHRHWDEYLARNAESNRQHRAELKAKAINVLGGRCVRCGYKSDIRALQFDHIASDGALERKANGINNWALYNSIIKHGAQGKYQVLCANCNQIKRMECNEHPTGKKRG